MNYSFHPDAEKELKEVESHYDSMLDYDSSLSISGCSRVGQENQSRLLCKKEFEL